MNLNSLIKQFLFKFDIRGIDTETLPNSPTGWRDMLVEYSRSKTYNGILRNITGQLDFFGKAAYILRREYAKYRLMARVNFLIDRDTRQPYNTYENLYTGQIDFSKKVDKQGTFTVGAKSLDFSQNIDAYDATPYSISLQHGINLELPGIALNEIASFIPSGPPDGNIHSDYFPPLQLVNNTQNSIDVSAQTVPYGQLRAPDFSTVPNWFYQCRLTGKLQITGNITYNVVNATVGSHHLKLYVIDDSGTIIIPIFDDTVGPGVITNTFTFNSVINVTVNQRLFLYMQQVEAETANTGITITNGEIDLAYQTITPPTMCQAIRGTQLFARLLQAMNVNQDSGPNLPVDFQSFLLSGALAPLVFTSSDSIRAAQGSIFITGNTIGPGVYKVISGSVTYAAVVYLTGQQFSFIATSTTFTGDGVVQKIQSVLVGNVYNIGDSLQAGGTYLVGGDNGGTVTYNGVIYNVGDFFKFVLGQDSFTGSDDSMYVKQIAIDPQISISFADFYQSVKSANGGDCAFGVNPKPFIETLANVFMGSGTVNLGNVPKDWQSECATDMLYNTIKVGQKKAQYDAINGLNEVCGEQYYSSPMLTPAAELNLFSPVRFDPYGIESARITQNDTAASRSDNGTFGIWINTTPVSETPFEYYRPLGSEGLLQPISGVPDSYYNYKLSPKTCLKRGDRYLASIYFGMSGYQLTLTGHENNIGMSYVGLDGVRIVEADPVQIAGLGAAYFIPEYYNFTIPGGLIDTNSYADMSFVVNGNVMRGFVMSYKCNFANNVPQPVKLLLGPGNDLGKAVR